MNKILVRIVGTASVEPARGVGKGTKSWDQYLSVAVAMMAPLAIMITAGLNARFQAIFIYGSNV